MMSEDFYLHTTEEREKLCRLILTYRTEGTVSETAVVQTFGYMCTLEKKKSDKRFYVDLSVFPSAANVRYVHDVSRLKASPMFYFLMT